MYLVNDIVVKKKKTKKKCTKLTAQRQTNCTHNIFIKIFSGRQKVNI